MIKRLFFLIIILNNVFAQADMTEGYRPRNLTRGKMWSSYRNNGLDGGGNRSKSDSHSQESLTYPGNMSRVALDFIEYFIDSQIWSYRVCLGNSICLYVHEFICFYPVP